MRDGLVGPQALHQRTNIVRAQDHFAQIHAAVRVLNTTLILNGRRVVVGLLDRENRAISVRRSRQCFLAKRQVFEERRK